MRKKTNTLIFPLLVMGLFLIFASSCKKDDFPKIGSRYAGGLVFYTYGGGHGLVCAESDQSAGAEWGCLETLIGGTSTDLYTGAANTEAIVAGCTEPGIAAKLCYDLSLNGYDDWFLPSKDELWLMYTNLRTQDLGGFASATYWSSSENDSNVAFGQFFGLGDQHLASKNSTYRVRAVREF